MRPATTRWQRPETKNGKKRFFPFCRLVEKRFNVDAVQVGLQKIRILKTTQVPATFFKNLVFHIKSIDLPALDQRLAFEALANEHTQPELFYLL
jgi:hypothetical protein